MTAPSLLTALAEVSSARKKPAQHEFKHQSALIEWARNPAVVRSLPGIELLSASLNGVHLSKSQAAKAKAAGMLAGELDLRLPVPRGGFVGLIIEMKHGRNKTTTEQEQYMARMVAEGHLAHVCYQWIEAREAIIAYLRMPRTVMIVT
jgi:hypothetical protein